MKKIVISFFLIAYSFCYSQKNIEFQYDLYTIDNTHNIFKIKLIPNNKVSFRNYEGTTRVFHLVDNKTLGFTHNTEIEEKALFILDSLKNKAKLPDKEISFFSFYNNNQLNFFESFFYLPKKNIFISLKNKPVIGIENLIGYRYGSVKKYNELSENKIRMINILSNDYNSLRIFLQNDYTVSEQIFPNDTIRAVDLFLKEVDTLVDLNTYEYDLIKEKIIESLKRKKYNEEYLGLYSISILRRNITNILAEILDEARFFKCLSHFIFYKKTRTNIFNKLYHEFEKKHPNKSYKSNDEKNKSFYNELLEN